MGSISNSFDDEIIFKLRNTTEFSNLVVRSRSFNEAIESFGNFLKNFSCTLLFIGEYDQKSIQSFQVWFSGFPEELRDMCTEFDGKQGCPLVQIAVRSGRPFDALDLYLEGFDEFFTMRYFRALKKLGYLKIGVVPVFTEQSVFVFFVGIDSAQVFNLINEPLQNAISQFITAAFVKYPQRRPIETDRDSWGNITVREKECLTWTAHGKTSDEIAGILGLSEHTVNAYLTNVSAKLDASNRVHAVVKALEAGIIDLDGIISK